MSHWVLAEQVELGSFASQSSMPLAPMQALLDMQALVPVPACASPVKQHTSLPLQSEALPHESATP